MRTPRWKRLLRRAARPVVAPAGERWRRWRSAREHPDLALDSIRRRLEILLAGVYGREIPVEVAPVPPRQHWIARLTEPRHLRGRGAGAASDGTRVLLPAALGANDGSAAALQQYRLLALEQGERIARGTAATAAAARDPLERDLFLLRESEAVDRTLARRARSIVPALAAARVAALSERPALGGLTPLERAVEQLVRAQLERQPAPDEPMPDAPAPAEAARGEAVPDEPARSPAESLAWARTTAARLRGSAGSGAYRGVSPVAPWGTVLSAHPDGETITERMPDWYHAQMSEVLGIESRGTDRGDELSEDLGSGGEPRADATQGDAAEEGSEPAGSDARDAKAPDEPQTIESPPGDVGSGAAGGAWGLTSGGAAAPELSAEHQVATYAEWDCYAHRHRRGMVTVRSGAPAEGNEAWVRRELATHGALVRRVRERFDRLRARRTRLRQQRDGDELDLAAVVSAFVDRRAGHAVDDRLYLAVRPARRGLAIALLVDVSGSTETPLADGQRVIDVEKTALLLASEALDALGDRYAVLAFSGRGAADVRLTTVKAFAEANGDTVRRRIGALAPAGNTRLGAAVRHATALLAREAAGHRLLLLLSDGRPNDVNEYQGDYAVEDSRQAVLEARAAGVYPYCLTVDREGPEYLARIFGAAGHTILRRPEHLPTALVGVVKDLLGTS